MDLYQYFVHSYAVIDLDDEHIIYKCNYEDVSFIAAVNKEKVLGFHFIQRGVVTRALSCWITD